MSTLAGRFHGVHSRTNQEIMTKFAYVVGFTTSGCASNIINSSTYSSSRGSSTKVVGKQDNALAASYLMQDRWKALKSNSKVMGAISPVYLSRLACSASTRELYSPFG